MALAVAGLFARGETEITDADCVNISFPGFFEILDNVAVR
jgi:3-phosphoshikimate 1-carboxyvinyltransferase